ncbi:phospholipase D family protein [Pseudalkalibacillus berkeleyi]|uniref:phospholipase D n=1 Tax=Pseudalkalibacillus berkeleyi TaxID=1069813 RepID=A0ABS9H1J3_9BACL|nr:phospholipase D family protein [Pseudalkalibacillus berkeleyi]MCF6138857.1 phospholipase D family protein [Pseudalkalibacillus berkeleyi]
MGKIKVTKKTIKWGLIWALILIYITTMVYQTYKPIPEGISYESDIYQVDDVKFHYDLTYKKGDQINHELNIFNRINEMISEADEFIVIDMFMFNGYHDKKKEFPPISENLAEAIIKKKQQDSDIDVVFISDEINTGYNSYESKLLSKLEDHGVEVVYTNLNRLRDPTPLYSGVWRMFFQWFGQEGDGWIRNPFANTAPELTARSYLKLLNVKANHRKIVATDKSALVSSANPHDASGYHNNVAFEVKGPITQEIINGEQAAVSMSEKGVELPAYTPKEDANKEEGKYKLQYFTEGKAHKHIVEAIEQTKPGQEIHLGMFYIADRSVIEPLIKATDRGVDVKIILDPNQVAFGNKKTGLPNIPVAMEMVEDSGGKVDIRWYNTTMEQYHTKMLYVKGNQESTIIAGSANYTKRNLEAFNLEADIQIQGSNDTEVMKQVDAYFERLWNNDGGKYTVDFETHNDKLTYLQRGIYAVQKFLRLTTY